MIISLLVSALFLPPVFSIFLLLLYAVFLSLFQTTSSPMSFISSSFSFTLESSLKFCEHDVHFSTHTSQFPICRLRTGCFTTVPTYECQQHPRQTGKYLEVVVRGTNLASFWKEWENLTNSQPVYRPGIETATPRIQIKSVTATSNCSVS